MTAHDESKPQPVLLIIADISGYTRFMTANARSLAHSQTIITELVKAIVKQAELPLEVAKLEGDAVFLFCRKDGGSVEWREAKRMIGERLLAFFEMFRQKVRELSASTTCNCSACAHIDKLRLKMIAHSGEAVFHKVFHFMELAGVDVIIAHRLLKNSVTSDQYLLLTEAARRDIEFTQEVALVSGSETYDNLGEVKTFVYHPEGAGLVAAGTQAGMATAASGFGARFGNSRRLFFKLWFSPLTNWNSSAGNNFRNLESAISMPGKMIFALITILLTPFFVPVGLAFAFFYSLRSPSKHHHHQDCQAHLADGSCCKEN